MRKPLITILALAVVAGTACSTAAAAVPDHGSTSRAASSAARGQLSVHWTPDIMWKHGRKVTTHGDAAQGHKLLRDVRAAKKVPKGAVYPCPADLGVSARFAFNGKHGVAQLTGCDWVTLGHRSYWIDNAITKDLRALAPHRWLTFLPLTPKKKLTVVWTPNVNWRHGHAKHTYGTAAQGHRLMRDIRAEKTVKHPGEFFCMIDFGVDAKFRFNGHHGVVHLGGCRFVVLGHHTYRLDAAVRKDLRAIAPHRWKHYLH